MHVRQNINLTQTIQFTICGVQLSRRWPVKRIFFSNTL